MAEDLRRLFPEARISMMTSDSGVVAGNNTDNRQPATVNSSIITAMTNGNIDILVGTQMIAKGHHFAGLALVGVIDADMGLAGGDLRAGERTYQLLHQLSGRAGREKTKGEIYLQTYMPEHPVMQALLAGDRDRFMLLEARMREEAAMPPYGKLAAIVVEGQNEQQVAAFARELVKVASGNFMGGALPPRFHSAKPPCRGRRIKLLHTPTHAFLATCHLPLATHPRPRPRSACAA